LILFIFYIFTFKGKKIVKILLFTQHYPPDIGAHAFRMAALVKALLKKGHKISVITTEPHRYDLKEKIQFKKYEKDKKLEICRIKGGKHNDKFWRRPINYIIFMVNSLIYSLKLKNNERYDLVFATSPPITSAATAVICAFFKKTKFILDIRDLWPDTLVELKIFKNKLIIAFLTYIEKLLYRRANSIITISEDIKDRIILKGVEKDKVVVFTNGLDKEFISENIDIEKKNALRNKYKLLLNKTIISYVGNIGISQALKIMVEAAEKTGEDILFLIVGEGLEKKQLLKIREEKKLSKKILFLNGMPRDKIIDIYYLSDILFLQLKDLDIFKGAIPSKIFEYLGSGVPIIYGLNGVGADVLKESGNGIKIRPESDENLVEAIKIIKNKYNLYIKKAKKGRDFAIKHYLREEIMNDYVKFIENSIK